MQVLDVQISTLSTEQVHAKIVDSLNAGVPCTITTLNPEILLTSSENDLYRNVLNNQTVHTVDGVGLEWVLRIKNPKSASKNIQRLTGIDLMLQLLEKISEDDPVNNHVFLLSSRKGLSTWKQTALSIGQRYPHVLCSGQDVDFATNDPLDKTFTKSQVRDVARAIEKSGAKYVLCNFGAPWQEYFLDQLKNARLEKPCVYIGVGGAFDFITGKRSRAPQWMRQLGLEWLFRLITQPRRLERIISSVLIFPYKALTQK